ncbi:MAG: ABC transporter ATP-binding protein [Acidimicrobiales bacterium]
MLGQPVISAHAVVKRWGQTTALSNATVDIGRGVTGLLGANGAGKTTLLGMVLGLHHADAGRLEVLGLDPAHAGAAVRARVGYAPEHHNLPPDMRAHDLVRHMAEVHGLPHREATGRASDALWHVGLGEERLRPLGTMSTGQRQRVKLAQAIAHDPALILLDEPTDGLDPVQRDSMLELIGRIGGDYGIDVVLSSHLLEEVERVCDAAVILSGGEVVAAGTLDELRKGGGGLLVELDDRHAEVAAALTGRGLDVRVEGRVLVVAEHPALGDGAYDVVRDVLAEQGALLRRLSPRRITLEDVFLGVGR